MASFGPLWVAMYVLEVSENTEASIVFEATHRVPPMTGLCNLRNELFLGFVLFPEYSSISSKSKKKKKKRLNAAFIITETEPLVH